ncbi:MAG: SpoIIE family protein phosphatase, partial [Bacteroidales bacterium]|nr:SpoIIE family protein phosphatase [Bacteroidales bacterium]
SGDFYWFANMNHSDEKDLRAILCVADCTGHGVPGALVSLVGSNQLDKTINEKNITNPAQILEMVNAGFQVALKQDETRNNDGMDMALIYIHGRNNGNEGTDANTDSTSNLQYQILFAGAKNPLVIFRAKTKELEFVKGSRKSIGGLRAKRSKQFYEKVEVEAQTGDVLYMFTDGIIDQHGVDRNRFTQKKLLEVLEQNATLSLSEQKDNIELELKNHQENERQTDDITLVGIKL